jgi:signal transduction histidine kinase
MGANPSEYVWLKIVRQDGTVSTVLTGGSVPYMNRPAYSMLLVLPFELAAGEQVTAYLGSQSTYSRGLHFQVRTEQSWHAFQFYVLQFEAFYFGMMFIVLLINWMAYVATQSPISRVYCVFIASSILVNIVGSGYLNYFGPADFAPSSARMLIFLIPFHLGILGYFTSEFLDLRSWSKWGLIYMRLMMAAAFLVAVLNFSGFSNRWIHMLFDWNIMISTIVTLWLAVSAARNKQSPYAWSFLIGFGIYLIGGNIWTMQFRSQLPSTPVNRYALFWAQVVENIVFTFAVMREARRQLTKISTSEAREQYGRKMGMFVKVLTHDLSNYMMIVEGSLRALSRPFIDDAQRTKIVERALKSMSQQKDVLESVKELKAVEDGKADLRLSRIDLREVLPDLFMAFEMKLAAKSVKLEFEFGVQGPVFVIADRPTLFHSVLCNLVSNAIKFSEKDGTVRLVVAEKGDFVTVEVIDTGIGMPAGLQAKIFSESEQTSRVGTAGERGTGFGLPIVKSYMSLYGGQITVESKSVETHPADHGTRFILRFRRGMVV